MINRSLAGLLVVVALAQPILPELEAGSLAPDPMLAAIQRVRFTVAGGEFEPIPGIDTKALKVTMKERCERALYEAGFTIGDFEDAYLAVILRHAWNGATRDEVAILLELNLWVPAVPTESRGTTVESRNRSLAIWRSQQLDLARSTKAAETILEALDLALEDLVQSTQAAQQNATESSWSPAPGRNESAPEPERQDGLEPAVGSQRPSVRAEAVAVDGES